MIKIIAIILILSGVLVIIDELIKGNDNYFKIFLIIILIVLLYSFFKIIIL